MGQRYIRAVISNGWSSYRASLRGGTRKIVEFVTQATLLFAVLYFAPWFGSVSDESRLVAASVGAIAGWNLVALLLSVSSAPARLHRDLEDRLEHASAVLRLGDDANAVKEALLALCVEGKAINAEQPFDPSKIEPWKATALAILRPNYAINFVYEFEHEAFWNGIPATPALRMHGLVQNLERTTLSWGSLAERHQERAIGTDFKEWRRISVAHD